MTATAALCVIAFFVPVHVSTLELAYCSNEHMLVRQEIILGVRQVHYMSSETAQDDPGRPKNPWRPLEGGLVPRATLTRTVTTVWIGLPFVWCVYTCAEWQYGAATAEDVQSMLALLQDDSFSYRWAISHAIDGFMFNAKRASWQALKYDPGLGGLLHTSAVRASLDVLTGLGVWSVVRRAISRHGRSLHERAGRRDADREKRADAAGAAGEVPR